MRAPLRHFNSIKVRLERKLLIVLKVDVEFQFHKGAIRTTYEKH